MGVRGLETYVEKCCQGVTETVSISEIAEKYRSETGNDPVIVMDFDSCVKHFLKFLKTDRWFLGGQCKELQAVVENFIKSLVNIGIKLVVFSDGMPVKERHDIKVRRSLLKAQNATEFFAHLGREQYRNNTSITFQFEDQMLPPSIKRVILSAFKSSENCTCYRSMKDADKEIAEYADNHNCFAILGQDTDFIIMGGGHYYLSMKYFDLNTMKTSCYNRKKLAEILKIDLLQLPLLATLCGNDVINADELKDFHLFICEWRGNYSVPFHKIFQCVAKFVRKQPLGKDVLRSLRYISKYVFRRQSHNDVVRLKTSLCSYWFGEDVPEVIEEYSDQNWTKILELAKDRYVNLKIASSVYQVMLRRPIYLSVSIEDGRNWRAPSTAEVLCPLRQRLYGIVLKERPIRKNAENRFINEWHMNTDAANGPKRVKIIFPDYHPGLVKLWEKDNQSLERREMRWRMLCKGVSKRLNHDEIMNMKCDIIVAVLALFYLQNEVKSPILKRFEIKVLLKQAFLVNKLTYKDIKECKANYYFSRRTIYLSNLFLITCRNINMLSAVCGHPITKSQRLVSNFFDGKIFHCFYTDENFSIPGFEMSKSEKSEVDYYLSLIFTEKR